MPARRIALLIVWLAVGLAFAGRSPAQDPAGAAATADERAARLAERYKAMLAANPVEGVALDRLWKSYEDRGATAGLIDEYGRASGHAPTAAPAPPVPRGSTAPAATALIYGHLLKKAGRLDEAAAAYRQAAALDAASPLPLLAAADLAAGRGQPADAAAAYEQALGKLPAADSRRSDVLLKLGSAWLAAGQPAKAAEQWESMIALDPANLALRRELAANYEKSNLPERAIAHFAYIEGHGSPAERAQALRDLGRLHQGRGEFDAARDAFERGLTLTSRENWLHGEMEAQLIRLYQRAGRVQELEARWRAAVDENPRDLGGYARLEHLAEAQADTAGQRAALQKIVALAPRDRDSTLKLARLLAAAGERAPAADLYDQLLRFQPDNLELLLARADLDLQLGRPAAAVERVEARVARSPGDDSVSSPALEFFLSHHLDEAAERRLRADVSRLPAADEPPLALAKFLFAQHKAADARAVLDTLAARPGEPAARGARLLRIADAYKEERSLDDALRCWRLAAELQPRLPAPLLAVSEVLLARGDSAGACAALERAVEATPAGPERVEVERKLFQALQTTDPLTGAPLPGGPGRGASGMPRSLRRVVSPLGMERPIGAAASTDSPAPPDGTPLARYLGRIAKTAETLPTAANYVRLAHWSQWAHDLPAALTAAETAARIDPRDIASRELLASLAVEGRQHEVAERWLREIMAIDPSRRAACLKQIANGKLDEGDFDAAVTAFLDLQRAAPGSVAALTDLALAYQRADRWFDALGAWERAYALPGATPAQRSEARRPLLVALERLDQFPRALELLQSAVEEQPDADAKQDLFRELLEFARQHGLLATVRKTFETRLKARPQDYFLLTALAELRRAAGREREAYQLLAQAYYSAPDPGRSLRALVEAAESLGALDEAVVYQRRLAALPGQNTPETLEKLASLEDGSSRTDAAARTWEDIAARFPRDPVSLAHAEAFFETSGNTGRARELLGQIVRINAADNRQLFHLGELDAGAGDTGPARAAYEQLLAHTEAEKAGGPLVLPASLDKSPALEPGGEETAAYRHAFRSAGTNTKPPLVSPEDSDARLRLKAIREISRLLFPAPRGNAPTAAASAAPPAAPAALESARRQWLAHWQEVEKSGVRSEPLWAFFYANQKGLVMDCLTRWLGKAPADLLLHKAFLGLGLRMGDYRGVAAWTWAADAGDGAAGIRGRELVQTLSQWLVGPDIEAGPNLVADLFPPGVKARDPLWLAANNVFAARGRFAEAAELGERIFDASPLEYRVGYGVDLAHWELFLGRPDRARSTLRRVLAENEGDTFDATGGGVFAALREYYLLLPPGERPPFVEEYLARSRAKFSAPHAVLAAVLLHGLAGDDAAARRDLDALLAMRLLAVERPGDSPDGRRWSYVLAAGLQLQSWNLSPLAVYLWRHALGEATGFDRQQSDSQQILAEVGNQLFLAEIALAAGPQDARERVSDFLRTRPTVSGASAVATQLMSAARPAEAALIYDYLCQLEPEAAEHWQERFAALRFAGDAGAAERLWRGLLEAGARLPAGLNHSDLVRQLASLLENELADPESARQLLWRERASDRGPASPILAQLALSYERAGQWENAARVWGESIGEDPAGATTLSVARIESQHLGRTAEALTLLKGLAARNLSPAERARVAVVEAALQLAAGQTDEAVELGFDLLHDNQPDAVASVAAGLSAHGQGGAARQLLAASARRTRDPQTRLRLQKALVEQIPDTPADVPVFQRELRRLRSFADETAPLRDVFDDVRFDLARKRRLDAWLEGELAADWRAGQGRLAAGEDLARLYLDTHRDAPLAAVVAQMLARPEPSEPALVKLQKSLADGGHPALALDVSQTLCRLGPQNDGYGLTRAAAFWHAGRPADARREFEALALTEGVHENICAQIGEACLELGDKALARDYLQRAAAADPLAMRAPQVRLQLAGLDLDAGRPADARRHLRAAYRNATCDDLKPLVRYLCATSAGSVGNAEGLSRLAGWDFPLAAVQRGRLLTLLAPALDAAGRGGDLRGVVAVHPMLLTTTPGLVGTLRGRLPPGDPDALADLAALVEGVVSQTDPPCFELNRQLAALYTAWADQELAAGKAHPAVDLAAAHLMRACLLDPGSFPAADRLARVEMDRKQEARAAEVLRDFLSRDALPEERAQAARMLHRG